MLFHTWLFLLFLLVVVPVHYGLRQTRLWLPWLLVASYFFYAWSSPYYLILIAYSSTLDFLVVALMDHCPREETPIGILARLTRTPFKIRALKAAFLVCALGLLGAVGLALTAPRTLRPALGLLAFVFAIMAAGAWLHHRRTWLVVSLVNNLVVLMFFKYGRFVVENLNALLGWLQAPVGLPDPSALMPFGATYLLPVGISFFTFRSMSYTIDFYRGNIPREGSYLRYLTFVAFFPPLLAGPIERARNLLPQLSTGAAFRFQNAADGLSLFLVGLFKKVAVANYLALYVERVYDNPGAFGAPALLLGTFAFAWQVFFDFSGYTDMARGVAKLMGFDLMLNFNNPYLATGLGDFWSRWHISLSTWFRDYVYIPLGGNRGGTFCTHRNLLITFLVSGLWHGAAWTFVIWGALHGLGVVLTRELERSAFYRERVPKLIKQAWVFAFVTFAWIFFRAGSLDDAWLIVRRIFTGAWLDPQMPALMVVLIALVWLYQFLCESRFRVVLRSGAIRVGLATAMMLYLWLCATGGGTFIYFQF